MNQIFISFFFFAWIAASNLFGAAAMVDNPNDGLKRWRSPLPPPYLNVNHAFKHLQKRRVGEIAPINLSSANVMRYVENLLHTKFVEIEGGYFWMGSLVDEPNYWEGYEDLHLVRLSPFIAAVHEMTQEGFVNVTGKNPAKFREKHHCPGKFEIRLE